LIAIRPTAGRQQTLSGWTALNPILKIAFIIDGPVEVSREIWRSYQES
jgi:hypothetical protein